MRIKIILTLLILSIFFGCTSNDNNSVVVLNKKVYLVQKYNADTTWENLNFCIDFQEKIIDSNKTIICKGTIDDIRRLDSNTAELQLSINGYVADRAILKASLLDVKKYNFDVRSHYYFIIKPYKINRRVFYEHNNNEGEESKSELSDGYIIFADLILAIKY